MNWKHKCVILFGALTLTFQILLIVSMIYGEIQLDRSLDQISQELKIGERPVEYIREFQINIIHNSPNVLIFGILMLIFVALTVGFVDEIDKTKSTQKNRKKKMISEICGKIIKSSKGKPALESYYDRHIGTHKLIRKTGRKE